MTLAYLLEFIGYSGLVVAGIFTKKFYRRNEEKVAKRQINKAYRAAKRQMRKASV